MNWQGGKQEVSGAGPTKPVGISRNGFSQNYKRNGLSLMLWKYPYFAHADQMTAANGALAVDDARDSAATAALISPESLMPAK